ncbi:NAD-glutamate dehydrogenase [Segnochrobactrum spirostomi]|uniref:NAD-glutamate dehydrogenase n=1 Tax=Segnochrobactrum spirostomi TaxID=2608987 RepID=A0A6A7Y5Z3_9HYPH|nr:NAD-glutamate dehydrogenase [Segnochrobactrum spirostomi]MQT13019.1 NAD-glutamate dehydrogenase [Segnochrobactrum spirostomi]
MAHQIDAANHGRSPEADDAARAAFAEAMFSRASAEDLGTYSPVQIRRLADEAFDAFAAREPGRHRIRLADHSFRLEGSHESRAITVVEVLNDDMPFLFDSVMGEIQEEGLEVLLVSHPILSVERDQDGRLVRFAGLADPDGDDGYAHESLITLHVAGLGESQRKRLMTGLDRTLTEVAWAVGDEQPMRKRVKKALKSWATNPPPGSDGAVTEAKAFVEWLLEGNFIFLGVREYGYEGAAGEEQLLRREDEGRGILRDPDVGVLRRAGNSVMLTPEMRAFLTSPEPVVVTKANLHCRVHRRTQMDYVGIKLFDAKGNLSGELRIVGLFTSSAYSMSPRAIPGIRRKIARVLERADLDPKSHSGKALIALLDHYPRDELFQIDTETLYEFSLRLLELGERPRIRVLARRDEFDRFVSVLVYVPRERYTTSNGRRIGALLAARFEGEVASSSLDFPEGPLARLLFTIGRTGGDTPNPPREELETAVASIVRTWEDELRRVAAARLSSTKANALIDRFGGAFSGAYRETYGAELALNDLMLIERLNPERRAAIDFLRRPGDPASRVSLRLFQIGAPVALSERVPILEAMGLRVINERTFRIGAEAAAEGTVVYLHDMTLERLDGAPLETGLLADPLEALFMAVWSGRAESDGFNALLIAAGIAWRDIAMVRALSRYLRQIRIPYSQDYMWGALLRSPTIARSLVDLFHTRFRPDLADADRATTAAGHVAAIETALDAVTSLDDDRILRRFLNVVQAIVRTNFFTLEADGAPPLTFSFKIDSHAVDDLPAPRPFREIWVYSPRVEGIHLRFGKVARGGLRWSDRPQDFRTEVLGLVKAQQVKNAVIVPVGAKGGFVPKLLPPASAGRDAVFKEGTEAYKIFVSALIALTDNIVGEAIVPPERVVRYDEDDPYLVVAADKGTATFSDTANAIAQAHGFWLDDAFASGGSAGYDHKKMGITARGAWEAVKRHFREIDTDIQTTPFTVAGVGDMSGDVFGNGMLLSEQIRLVAAFDHRDIFLDPDPDPAASFAERRRLFDLPRSSWADYDRSLISTGGGLYSRSLKSIPLSAEVKARLGLTADHATPAEVMSAILRAEVDLLWFGGIGTYVRASTETDADAGDRANDAIRVAAATLRAKVVGEGANLGMTQRARIEAGRHGIRLNTDAIDNSAGVNTSDVEVNIKIALATPMRDGRLAREDRDVLLSGMTDDVAKLVLANNYRQPLALSLAQRRGLADLGFQQRLMQSLEQRGLLDRAVEFLPDDPTLAERARTGDPLTRAELAVLLAYAKLTLYDDLLKSSVPDDSYLARDLYAYFPHAIRDAYPDAIESHRLRREIIATAVANAIINFGGPAFAVRLADETGADAPTIAAGFAAASDAFRLGEIYGAIDALDNRVAGDLQLELYGKIGELLLSRTIWFIRNVDLNAGLDGIVGRYRDGIDALAADLDAVLPEDLVRQKSAAAMELVRREVPGDVAIRLTAIRALALGPDAVLVAERTGRPVTEVGATLFALVHRLQIEALAANAAAISVADYYERLALDRALDRIGSAIRAIAGAVAADGTGVEAVDRWLEANPSAARIRRAVQEIAASGLTLAKLTVAAGLLGDLAPA